MDKESIRYILAAVGGILACYGSGTWLLKHKRNMKGKNQYRTIIFPWILLLIGLVLVIYPLFIME